MFTVSDLLAVHDEVTSEARTLMVAKNADYAHGKDAFRNFRRHGGLGVLVRRSDKLARLESYEERGDFKVKGEGLEDTVRDIVNYAVIYLGLKREQVMGGAASPRVVVLTQADGSEIGHRETHATDEVAGGNGCGLR